jgi:hypothetical protein
MKKTIQIIGCLSIFFISTQIKSQSSTATTTLTGTETLPNEFLGSSTIHDVIFKTNSIERFRLVQSTGLIKLSSATNIIGATNGIKILGGAGNTSTTPAYSFNSTSTGLGMYSPSTNNIAFATSGSERIRINSMGNVGIGTTSTYFKVHLSKSILEEANLNSGYGTLAVGANNSERAINFGVGQKSTWIQSLNNISNSLGGSSHLNLQPVGGNVGIGLGIASPGATLEVKGNVIIGSVSAPNTNYKLFVETGILTEKVKVAVKTTINWSDYVFAKEYELESLNCVEEYIKENKHLQNIPSAEEVVKDGIDLGEMDAKLLAKIEELTLYLIEQNKKLESLQNEVNSLKKN